MSLGGQTVMRGRGRARYVLESGDPGIPLDRVPYFTTDLVRLGVVGAVMVVLLFAADFALAQLVK